MRTKDKLSFWLIAFFCWQAVSLVVMPTMMLSIQSRSSFVPTFLFDSMEQALYAAFMGGVMWALFVVRRRRAQKKEPPPHDPTGFFGGGTLCGAGIAISDVVFRAMLDPYGGGVGAVFSPATLATHYLIGGLLALVACRTQNWGWFVVSQRASQDVPGA